VNAPIYLVIWLTMTSILSSKLQMMHRITQLLEYRPRVSLITPAMQMMMEMQTQEKKIIFLLLRLHFSRGNIVLHSDALPV